MKGKKTVSWLLVLCIVISCFTVTMISANAVTKEEPKQGATAQNKLANNVQDGVILHCWNWSYNNIKNNMQQIAASGYSAIQTSPVTQPKDYKWQGLTSTKVGTPNGQGGNDGEWWKVYQPVTFSICDNGETWFGTKAEFKAMCAEAEKYGVKVLVDIVANHMGNIKGWKNSLSDVSPQIGEYWNKDMLTDPTYWHINDLQIWFSDGRKDVTQGSMGMPDLNTKDKRVQNMILDLLKECVDNGADGFRFDAAKHIETPDDDASFSSDFWPTVLNGARNYAGKDLYVYGEILNRVGDGLNISSYTKYMSVTDNGTGDNKRNDIRYGNAGSAANSGMAYAPNKTVLWAESHDTYMGGGSSYLATDKMIKQTWAMVGSRKDATALYFARPYYSNVLIDDNGNKKDTTNLVQAKMGEVGTTTWCDPSISAINNFHNYYIGQSESLSSDGQIAYNERGTTGVVIAKLDGPGAVNIPAHKMVAGSYVDHVTGTNFTVSGGRIKGTVSSSDGIAVLYPAQVAPTNTLSQKGGSFATETLNITLGLSSATSGTYQIDNGAVKTYTTQTEVTLGSGVPYGTNIKLNLTATNGNAKTSMSYTFKKEKIIEPTEPSVTEPTQPIPTEPTTPPVPTESYYIGDADGNKKINTKDIYKISMYLADRATLEGIQFTAADVNVDGKANARDMASIQNYLAEIGTNIYKIGTIKESEPINPTEPTDPNKTTITFTNSDNWSGDIKIYYWNDSEKPLTWPGVAMTPAGTNTAGQKIYTYSFDKKYTKIIFTNGKLQTKDIIYGTNTKFDCSGNPV